MIETKMSDGENQREKRDTHIPLYLSIDLERLHEHLEILIEEARVEKGEVRNGLRVIQPNVSAETSAHVRKRTKAMCETHTERQRREREKTETETQIGDSFLSLLSSLSALLSLCLSRVVLSFCLPLCFHLAGVVRRLQRFVLTQTINVRGATREK